MKLKNHVFTLILITIISCDKKNDGLIGYTNIPDSKFEEALIDLGYDDRLDGKVLNERIKTISSLDIRFEQIKDLKGIEGFVELKTLKCSFNELTNLDLSENKKLVKLDCGDNELSNLDVSENNLLQELICRENRLTSIDVSNNTSLIRLVIEGNNILNVNLENNIVLRELWTDKNELKDLDVSNNTNLLKLVCNYNTITTLDLSGNPDLRFLSCTDNEMTSLDVSSNISLFHLYCGNNRLLRLNLKNGINRAMTKFNAERNNLTCVEVDNPSWSSENWSRCVDNGVTFNKGCH